MSASESVEMKMKITLYFEDMKIRVVAHETLIVLFFNGQEVTSLSLKYIRLAGIPDFAEAVDIRL